MLRLMIKVDLEFKTGDRKISKERFVVHRTKILIFFVTGQLAFNNSAPPTLANTWSCQWNIMAGRFKVGKGAVTGSTLLGIAAALGYSLYKSVYTGTMNQ